LRWLVSGPEWWEQVGKFLNVGAVFDSLKCVDVPNFLLHVPPLNVQRSVAAILAALDQTIELNRRMNATLEEMARALFKSWFVDFDPVRAKLDGREPVGIDSATARLFPGHFEHSDVGLVPSGWAVKRVYDTANFINGVAFRNVQFSEDGSGLPVVKIAELKDGVTPQTRFTHDVLAPKYKIKDGEVLFSWSGSPDTSIDTFVWVGGDGWLNQHIFKVEFARPLEKAFVYCMLKYLNPVFIEIARDKQTTGLGHVTVQDMKRLKVTFPSDEVLAAFARVVDPLLHRAFVSLAESRALVAVRDSLLPNSTVIRRDGRGFWFPRLFDPVRLKDHVSPDADFPAG